MAEMSNLSMVRECYEMMEKQDFQFAKADKKLLLGYAFHQRDLDCVHDAVFHIAAAKESAKGALNAEIVKQYSISGKSEIHGKIVEYIIQLEVANINQERANRLLVEILRERSVDYELDQMLEELRKHEEEKKNERESRRR